MNVVLKIVPLIPPTEDMFSGTVITNPLDLSSCSEATLVIYCGDGGGMSNIVVEACDENGLNAVPIEFLFQEILTVDDYTELVSVPADGITTSGVQNMTYILVINSRTLALSNHSFIRVKALETEKVPTLGCIIAVLASPRYS